MEYFENETGILCEPAVEHRDENPNCSLVAPPVWLDLLWNIELKQLRTTTHFASSNTANEFSYYSFWLEHNRRQRHNRFTRTETCNPCGGRTSVA